jgi:choline dehydrogenase
LSEVERLASGTEVEDAEHLEQLMLRDINHPNNHYVPGVYQDVVSVGPMRRRSGARNMITEAIEAGYPITLSTHSLATKVLIKDGPVPVAYGVEYLVGEGLYGADRRYDPEQQGELKTVTALKEVIVAGGAFNTPQILKLSGIGPREELEKHNIPVIVDLPGVVSI